MANLGKRFRELWAEQLKRGGRWKTPKILFPDKSEQCPVCGSYDTAKVVWPEHVKNNYKCGGCRHQWERK